MTGELWWVPSAIVLGVVGVIVALLVGLARRRTRARDLAVVEAVAERARAAAIALVRADDLIEANTDELAFALAQFGAAATRDFADALALSSRQLREAFALQQKLDDGIPDSETERRRWTEQIAQLAGEATTRLEAQTRDFSSRRSLERDAPLVLEKLERRVDRVGDRVAAGAASLARLSHTYSESALAVILDNAGRAQGALEEARAASAAAAAQLAADAALPVGDQLQAAEHGLFRAGQLLDAIETGEDRLHLGFAGLARALEAADAELAEARALRDGHEEPDARAELNRVIGQADSALGELRRPARLSDPAADLARLREAMDGLDIIRSEARNRQLRLDNARGALSGALLAVRSQLTVTRDFITAHRGRVGADARTRLAESERQLTLALAEADPVAALDGARRAMTLATDADALARFDAR